MIQLGKNGHHRRPGGYRALGLFVAVWLNLALAPCAMALDEHSCPHCPPAGLHEQHHGGNRHDAAHPPPCAEGAPDCMLSDDFSHDGRGTKLKLKDAPPAEPAAVAAAGFATPLAEPAFIASAPRYATVHAGAPPPLHVLYCVYLD